jgi:hypothetical protein
MTGNLDMDGNFILNVAEPINGTDAANKTYVDNVVTGLKIKAAVTAYADSNGIDSVGGAWTYDNGVSGVGATLTRDANGAAGTIDGVTTTLDERVLVAGRTNAAENGIYVVTALGDGSNPTVLTRCGLCDEDDEIPSSFTFVNEGTVYADTGWVLTVDDISTFTVGTDDIDPVQFSGSGSVIPGVGLSATGTTLNVNLGAGIFELPTDEVGIELFDSTTGAIVLTEDGSTRSTTAAGQLHLLLASGGGLIQNATGLLVQTTTFAGDAGSSAFVLPGQTVNFTSATGSALSTDVTGTGPVTVEFDIATATAAATAGSATEGTASFNDTDFVVTAGFVELNPVGVQESISLTFAPVSGDDIILTGTDDTLNIDSTTLTVEGNAGTATITIDLNAALGDLNDVYEFFKGAGAVNFDSIYDRIGVGGEGTWTQDLLGPYPSNPYGERRAPWAGYVGVGHQRGGQVLAWDPYDQQWVAVWSDSLIASTGMRGFGEWVANAKYADEGGSLQTITGQSWYADVNIQEAGAVFARWDVGSERWANFTPAQMVSMLNAQGGLTGTASNLTVAGDAGTPQTIVTGTDTLTIAGGTGIDTTAGATDTVTIDLAASVNDLTDVTTTTPAAGEALVWDSGNSDFRNVPFHYVESSASATSHVINHGLGQQYVNVTVVDGSDQVIIPQSITMTDANNLTVTLSSAAAVTVIVTGVAGV